MNIVDALANPQKMRRVAQMALFLPAILQIHESVVTKMPKHSAAERKATALGLTERLVVQLSGRGFLPLDLQEGLHGVIGEVYDSVVVAVDR